MLPGAELAKIGVPVIPDVGSLRTILVGPFDDHRPGNSRDRLQRRTQRGAVVSGRSVVVDQNRVGAMHVAIEFHPIENPFDRVVLRHREDDATIAKYFAVVWRYRKGEVADRTGGPDLAVT